tara:strand:+ start:278 stop:439 length:162 start_codon:yes stop_codon:yes gene_type:complete
MSDQSKYRGQKLPKRPGGTRKARTGSFPTPTKMQTRVAKKKVLDALAKKKRKR